MMIVNEISKADIGSYDCSLVLDGEELLFAVRVTVENSSIRHMQIRGISDDEAFRLMNADEYRAFQRMFWRLVDGESVSFPRAMASDWSSDVDGQC